MINGHTEILNERPMNHVDYRNIRIITQLLITARFLQKAALGKEAIGAATLALVEDTVTAFGDGETLRIETYELAREMGIQISEHEMSQVSQGVH
jgi:hypothetical protein